MKKIKFGKISMLNFRGIREATYSFGEKITTISGKNGLGKTSIFDAITYCLFGTDHNGKSIDIKTWDKDHQVILDIPHEVELSVIVEECSEDEGSGCCYLFKRTLTDSVDKDGKIKNTFKYYCNGAVLTASAYQEKVNSICDFTLFRTLSSATYFTSLKSEDQRAFLQSIVPDVTTDDITQGDSKYDFILEALKQQGFKEYINSLKYQRNEVQKQLDNIPVRISELNKVLPQEEDWDQLEGDKTKATEELDSVNAKIADAKTGGADYQRLEGIRKRIEFANKRKDNMEKSARNLADENVTKHESDLLNASSDYSKKKQVVDDLKQNMKACTETEIHLNKMIDECKQEVVSINDSVTELNSKKWQWNDDDSICPHCGQPLPIDKVREMKEESQKRFKQVIADGNKKLKANFDEVQKNFTAAKDELAKNKETATNLMNSLKTANEQLSKSEKELENVKAETPKSYKTILAEKEEYQNVLSEIKELEEELSAKPDTEDNNSVLQELEERKSEIAKNIEALNTRLSKKETFVKVNARIDEAKADKITYQKQIDEFDQKIDVSLEYQQKSCQILEDRVNSLFSYVKWSMFRANLDGVKTPYCECHHDGVCYHDLNSAAKVNAGLDIAYTFSKIYNVSVPIVLDSCESNLSPIYQGGQQIRLAVANTDSIEVEYGD